MGLSTHVLDTAHGCPCRWHGGGALHHGRRPRHAGAPLHPHADGATPTDRAVRQREPAQGTYRLVFEVAAYFRGRGVQLPDPPFLDRVILDFGIAHADQHYHVPLVCSPWTYSTYRGS